MPSGIVAYPSLMRPSPNEGHGFGGIVVGRQAAVVEAACQRGPARPHTADGLGELGFSGELAYGLVGPSGQGLGNRL